MRHIALTLSAVALALLSFGAGYWYRVIHAPPSATVEDYALANILENVGYAYFLSKGDTVQLRELLDVNLNGHLSRVRENQGAIDDEAFRASKIRTLNAAANLWEEHPPFTSDQWRENDTNKIWWSEWKESRAKNTELLLWARQQCATTPSLNCRPPPFSPNNVAKPQ